MASSSLSILFLSLLIWAAASPLASGGLAVGGVRIDFLRITGTVTCRRHAGSGRGIVSTVVSGAVVTLQCGRDKLVLTQAITNAAGFYQNLAHIADDFHFDASTCCLKVRTPVAGCTITLPGSVTQAPLPALQLVQSKSGHVAAGIVNFAL